MISIIIPAHNEKSNLEHLLPKLEAMAGNVPFEILVALSFDTTDSSEQIHTGGLVRFIRSTGKGRALQMNEIAAKSIGEMLVFLHADVTPPKTFLTDIYKTLTDRFEAGFFSYKFDKQNFFLNINSKFTRKDGIFTGGGDQCLFIKKSVFEDLGGFDENQVLMEDFEFFDRMKKAKISYKIIHNDLIVSARKYQYNSYVRVNLSNFLLLGLFKLGYPSEKLKKLSCRLLRTSY